MSVNRVVSTAFKRISDAHHSWRSILFMTLLLAVVSGVSGIPRVVCADEENKQVDLTPVAIVFGVPINNDDLVNAKAAEQKKSKLVGPVAYAEWLAGVREAGLRSIAWQAMLDNYGDEKNIEPTRNEIELQVRKILFLQEVERAGLLSNPDSPAAMTTEMPITCIGNTALKRMEEARVAMRRSELEQKAAYQVRMWKINRELHREFGGRIVYRAGKWEPIDAYRSLLKRYQESNDLMILDPSLRASVAVLSEEGAVTADEKSAALYFAKPDWIIKFDCEC
jgi:hypothetical protein